MTYRDDHDALRSYHGHLVDELARLEAKASELAGVQADRDRMAAELARVRRDLDQQRARRSPIRLDNLRVASPCKEPWAKMTGDDRVRDCAKCEKPVFDLSKMTSAEAEELLATRGITACVRFFRRSDGTVMTQDCPVGAQKKRRGLAIAAGIMAAGVAGGAAASMLAKDPPRHDEVLGGAMAMPEPEMGKMAPPDLPAVVETPPEVTHEPEVQMLQGGALAIPDDELDTIETAPHHHKKSSKHHH